MQKMTTPVGRPFAAGLATVVLATAMSIVVGAGPAFAAACSTTAPGVTMVVDFASLGGGIRVACAPGDPSSGYNALHAAGFTTAGTNHDGSAFVCRINDAPPPSQEACNLTPPASAYWSYWHARPGGTWVYSQLGAMAYDPAPGSVEGWAFGAGSPPAIAPPWPVVPPAPPTNNPKPPASQPSTHPTTPPTVGGATTNGGPAPASSGSATTNSATAGATDGAAQTSPGGADPSAGVPGGQSAAPPSTGSPVGTITGVAVVLGVAAGAAALAMRRRRRQLPDGPS